MKNEDNTGKDNTGKDNISKDNTSSLSSNILEKVTLIKNFENQADFFYLFANDSAVEFYKKCGYTKVCEKQYHLNINHVKMDAFKDLKQLNIRKIDLADIQDERIIQEILKNRDYLSNGFGVKDDLALLNFYIMYIFSNNLYLDLDHNIVFVVSKSGNNISVNDILCAQNVVLEDVIPQILYISKKYMNIEDPDKIELGFKPIVNNNELLIISDLNNEDSTTMVKMKTIIEFVDVRFPSMSHA